MTDKPAMPTGFVVLTARLTQRRSVNVAWLGLIFPTREAAQARIDEEGRMFPRFATEVLTQIVELGKPA